MGSVFELYAAPTSGPQADEGMPRGENSHLDVGPAASRSVTSSTVNRSPSRWPLARIRTLSALFDERGRTVNRIRCQSWVRSLKVTRWAAVSTPSVSSRTMSAPPWPSCEVRTHALATKTDPAALGATARGLVVSATVVTAPGAFGGYGSGLAPSNLSPFSSSEWFIKGTEPAKIDDWFVAGCAQPDGSTKVAMKINDSRAPATFQRYTEQWIRDAIAGRHSYGRYSWNLAGPDPCPSPSPSLTPVPTQTPVPTRTPTPLPVPTPTPTPTPTPKKT